MPGEKLLQEFLPPSQLRHALSELLHALFQVSRCSSFEQAVFQAVEPEAIPPPPHPEYKGARQRGTERPKKHEFIHAIEPGWGTLSRTGLGNMSFAFFLRISG